MAGPLSSLQQAFKSLTIGGVISVLVAYLGAHFDPAVFGPTIGPMIGALIGVIVGVLSHHQVVNTTTP
jgi:tetrahydromethanopterin S-methyltransferase subunit C